MAYFDFYIAPVPKTNRAAYERQARTSAKVLRECGATRVVECWMDESGAAASTYHGSEARLDSAEYGTFPRASGATEEETVVVSFVEWPDKTTRDAGMEKFTGDPRTQFDKEPPAFDGKRLVAAGFKPMLSAEREA